MREVDLIIVGGGPAGIAAGIYAQMDKTNFLLIEEKSPCQFMKESINSHYFIDGFTGTGAQVSGTMMSKKFFGHYRRLGGKIVDEHVEVLKKIKNKFLIITNKQKILAKSVIIASGTKPKELKVAGIENYKAQIHFFCTLEGDKYKGKNVIVVGGRNSGAVAACYLHDRGCKVSLLELQDQLPAKAKYQTRLRERKIKVYLSANLKELIGKNRRLDSIEIEYKKQKKTLPVDALFIYIGGRPNLEYCKLALKKDQSEYLITNDGNETSVRGVFAAGDVTRKLKQVITACGDGANAYYFAKKYIDSLN